VRGPRRDALAPLRAGFFKADPVAGEKPPYRAAAAGDPSIAHRSDDFIQRQIRLIDNQNRQPVGALLQWREAHPKRGLAVMLPISCQRCSHLIAELGLTSNRSAASRRGAPVSTTSSTRSRKS